ncbi:putative hydrolase, partial [Hyphodiscus hymeniophilus]
LRARTPFSETEKCYSGRQLRRVCTYSESRSEVLFIFGPESLDDKMETPRLPTKADFPSTLVFDLAPPPSGPALNILILLHGLGDTNTSFTTLGRNLNLPQTASLSLQAPNPIPAIFTGSDAPSFHWGDDVLIDEQRGEIELDAGFVGSTKLLGSVVEALTSRCQYPLRSIMFLGYGQGGMVALSFIKSYTPSSLASSSSYTEAEFGGVISIGAGLPSSSSSSIPKCRTPILVCGGSRSSQVTRNAVDRLKKVFGDVEYVKWEKADDSMMRNREEMLPLMRFFARRLRSRVGVPEEAVEVG